MKENRTVYFDNAATTPVKREVLDAMLPYFSEVYGNTSSVHFKGREGEKALMEARERIAKAVGCRDNEVYFTSGGAEADNWAIKGYCTKNRSKGNRVIISAVEHAAVLEAAKQLSAAGFEVIELPVDANGLASPEKLAELMAPGGTVLVSVMFANNEIGTIQPVRELAEITHKYGAAFHTDAVQAAGSLPIDFKGMGFDMMSLSAHKFFGPKGCGALIIKNGIRLERLISGGGHERGQRAGTLNLPAIVGMAKALAVAEAEREKNAAYTKELRDYLIGRVLKEIPAVRLNGDPVKRLPGNANFSFRYVEGEAILFTLDNHGICASSGSACSSGSLEPSHVLLAIGLSHEVAHGSVRLSLSSTNTREEVDYVVDKLKTTMEKLRAISPLNASRTAEINIKGESHHV